MAQLPWRMGQLQERMRFRTSERWMSAKSRAHFPRRAWWYASATDPALTTNRDHSSAAVAFSATSLPCLHANDSAISTPAGASRTSFRLTQLSLQEAGSGIGFGPGSRQYGRRSGTEWRFRLGSRRQVSQSPSHICSGRFLNDVAMTLWHIFQSGWVKIRRNASAEEKWWYISLERRASVPWSRGSTVPGRMATRRGWHRVRYYRRRWQRIGELLLRAGRANLPRDQWTTASLWNKKFK